MAANPTPLRRTAASTQVEAGAAEVRVEGLRVLLRIPEVAATAALQSGALSDGALGSSPSLIQSDAQPEGRLSVAGDPAAALAALASSLRATTTQLQADAAATASGPNSDAASALQAAALAAGPRGDETDNATKPAASGLAMLQAWLRAATGRWLEPQSLISIAAVLCVCSITVMLLGRRPAPTTPAAGPVDATANMPAEIMPPPVALGEPSDGMPTPPADLLMAPAEMPTTPPSEMANAPAISEPSQRGAEPQIAGPPAGPSFDNGPALDAASAANQPAKVSPQFSSSAQLSTALPPVANMPAQVPGQTPANWPRAAWPNLDQVERLPPLSAGPNSPGSGRPGPTRNGPDGVLRNRFAEPSLNSRAAVDPPQQPEFVARRPEAVANQPATVHPQASQPALEVPAQPPAARITRITPLAEAEPGAAP